MAIATDTSAPRLTDGQISLLGDVFSVARHYSKRVSQLGLDYEQALKDRQDIDSAVHDWMLAQADLHAELSSAAIAMIVTIPDVVAAAAAESTALADKRAASFFGALFDKARIAEDFTP